MPEYAQWIMWGVAFLFGFLRGVAGMPGSSDDYFTLRHMIEIGASFAIGAGVVYMVCIATGLISW